jgi:3-oxoadipate enol-lactonase
MERTVARALGVLTWDDIGPRDAAVVLVLLHGFPHDRTLWQAQIDAHASAFPNIRLLVPDLPGFGDSAPLSAPSMDGYADAVADLLDSAVVERAVIGGLSMGGYIAFAFWRRYSTRMRALLLLDTKAGADTDAARAKRRDLIVAVERDGVGPLVPGLLEAQLGATTRAEQPALVARVATMLGRAPTSGVSGAAFAMMHRDDSTATLDTITVPTLVVVGDEDTLTPVNEAIAMASAIRGSRLVIVPGAGHVAPLEQPITVNAAIAEFLDVAVRDVE